ncbi:MAG TPA: hypothetical protein VMY76_09295 [Gemmatimonadales bacterium]|nr:hypothetical protein [Gemmatimonadales bacterium]
MMRAMREVLWGALLVAAVNGCGSRNAEAAPEPELDPDTPVLVEIDSHFQGDVIIYLAQGSQRQRLGSVTALSRTEFSFPWRRLGLSGSSRLLAYPLAGARAYLSEPLHLQPGQSVRWTLESDLDRSSLAVY